VHSWSTFGARTNHGHKQIHKTHHGPDLKEATTFPFIIFSMLGYGAYTQMSLCPKIPKLEIPKFSDLGLPQLWKPITFHESLQLKWGLKQSYNPRQEFSKYMWHTTCTQLNQGDSWLLMVENQIGNLIFDLSFDHNLCFKYSNGTCEPISDIYVLRAF
jgi:hypothetical protein